MNLRELRTWLARRIVSGRGAPTLADIVREVPMPDGRARAMLAEGLEERLWAEEFPKSREHALGPVRYGVTNPVRKIIDVSMIQLATSIARHGSAMVRLKLACGHTRPMPEHVQPRVGAFSECHTCMLIEGGWRPDDERRNMRSTVLDETTAEAELYAAEDAGEIPAGGISDAELG